MTGTTPTQSPPGTVPGGFLAADFAIGDDRASPGLPEGIWRDGFIETLIVAYRAELRPADQAALRFYAQHTRPQDWSEPGRGPICYVGQLNTAEQLHLDRKSIYKAERTLERLGLIEKTALANGHRRGPRGTRIEAAPLGICFAPAIACYPEIAARAETIETEREALIAWRYRVSGLRTRLRIGLRDAPRVDPAIDAIMAAFTDMPSQIARIGCIDALAELEEQFQALLDELGEHLDRLRRTERAPSEPVPGSFESRKNPHKRGSKSPHHIYSTTNPPPVICTPEGDWRTGAHAPDTDFPERATAGERLWKKPDARSGPDKPFMRADGEGRAPVNWTVGQLLAAAGNDFRFCLQIHQPNAAALRPGDFVEAASDLAAALGINRSAWIEACHVLGRFEAALAVLILDRNRLHPMTPVHSPGGALRGMIAKARAGDLNLDASLFGILRRSSEDEGRPH